VAINQRGYSLLEALLDAEGAPVSKQTLMEKAWPGARRRGRQSHGADRRAAQGAGAGRRQLHRHRAAGRLPVRRAGRDGGAAPAKPSVAVLPFDNLSADPEQEYFADGVVEDIITALSRFKSFAVIARNSSFVYKGRAVDIRQVARSWASATCSKAACGSRASG
jgi:hypothetical protein